MKKLILIFVTFLLVVNSCTGERESANQSNFIIEKNTSRNLQDKVSRRIDLLPHLSKKQFSFDFNIKDAYYVSNKNESEFYSVVVRENNYDIDNYYSFATYLNSDDEIVKSQILQTIKIDDDVNKVLFYDEYGNYQCQMIFNKKTEQVLVDNNGASLSETSKGCGSKVANCISDAYTNDGWASVGLWVATAFYPEVAVATALVCTKTCS